MKTKNRSLIYLGLPVGAVALLLLALFFVLPGGAAAAPDAAIVISEFQPNPTGVDPSSTTVELSGGTPSATFDLWFLSIENDGYNGTVDRASHITGNFDANGFVTVTISDLENPSFTVILTDNFTGTVGSTDIDPGNDGVLDLSTLGTVLDAVGVSDNVSDDGTMYGVTLGGVNILYNGIAEPFLAFRDGTNGDWYSVVDDSGTVKVFDADGTELNGSDFDNDPTVSNTFNTFGAVNPSYLAGNAPAFDLSKHALAMVSPGVHFTYTLTITNSTGVSTTGTIITDVLPISLTFVSASDGGVHASGVVSWTVPGTFTDGLTISRTFQATAPSATGAKIVNDNYAVHATEWMTLTYGAPITTTISPLDLVVDKIGPASVVSGEDIAYTIEVFNQGITTAHNLVVTDTLPISLTNIISSSNALTVTSISGPDRIVWEFGDVISDTTETIYLTGTVDAGVTGGTVLTNTVEASTDTAGDNPANNHDEVQTTVLPGPQCGNPATFIHVIQGSGGVSPEDGNVHTIEGVVVGDYQAPGGGINGFFVQEEDADADSDPTTSEGIFIYDGYSPAVDVNVGEVVRVAGTVDEYYGLTQLTSVSGVEICPPGGIASAATPSLPVASVADWEWYEGMLLNITQTLYVTEHYNLGRYGEISLSASDRLFNPTQVITPGLDANTLQDLNDRSRVQLNDAATGQNPDPIIYPSPELSATNTLRGGDTLPGLTGVMNYSYGAYLIEPVEPITFTHSNPRPAAPDSVGGSLQVASFNVLNYFSTIDTGADICGPAGDMGCRGADSASEFTRQRDKIINAILAIDADVIGLMEMENHPTDAALDDLVSGLNAIAGAGTYAKIDTGTIGDDAIKVAFIYKPATVSPVGDHAILDDTFDANYYDDYNRPALAQTFQENASSAAFTVVVNHFKSKGSDCDDIGDPDTGDGQGNCNLTRTSAANVMLDWLATDPTASGDPKFLIIGDLNSYAMEDPIAALEAGGFTDLYRAFGGDDYSYVYGGQWGTLDYSLASAALLPDVTGATAWHINGDEPRSMDYNEEYKSLHHIESLYAPDAYRASDHDPIIVGLDLSFELPEASFVSNSPVTLGEVSVFTNTSTGDAPLTYLWDFGDSITATLESPTHTYEMTGTYTVTLTVTNVYGSDVYTDTHTVEAALPETWEIYLPLIFKSGD